MMRYLLDTNTCIHVIKHHPSSVQERLATIPIGDVGVSSMVLAELWYGIAHSGKRQHNEQALTEFLDYVEVLDWPREAAPIYGRVRSFLRKRGTPIGAMDLLIAAHALTLDAALVTDNVAEFRRVPKLKIENWIDR